MTYKAIIFDLGKVLVHFDFKRGYRELEPLCPHAAAEIPKRLSGTGLVQRFESGLVEPREFVAELTKILDLNVDFDRFCDIWSCIFAETLVPDSLVEALGAHLEKVGMIHRLAACHVSCMRFCQRRQRGIRIQRLEPICAPIAVDVDGLSGKGDDGERKSDEDGMQGKAHVLTEVGTGRWQLYGRSITNHRERAEKPAALC